MEVSELRKIVGDGKIFSATFRKRTDGTVRRMVARTGVHSGTAGGSLGYDPDLNNLLPVFDLQARGYRTIPAENVTHVRAKGVDHYF